MLGFTHLGGFAVDWTRGRAYRGAATSLIGGEPVISTFDLGTLTETARTEVAIAGGNFPEVLAAAEGGALYARTFNGLSTPIYRLDGDTLAITGTFGSAGSAIEPTATDATAGYAMAVQVVGDVPADVEEAGAALPALSR
jgi:hypothetical protein